MTAIIPTGTDRPTATAPIALITLADCYRLIVETRVSMARMTGYLDGAAAARGPAYRLGRRAALRRDGRRAPGGDQ